MINSHIIPAFYLEQFATPSERGKENPGRIWVYERENEPDNRATSVQGREKGYFGFIGPEGKLEESFETVLAQHQIDCNVVLVCAKYDTFHWPVGSHEKLAFYAALLYSRATQRRAFTGKNSLTIATQLREAADDAQFVKEIADALSRKLGQPASEEMMRNSMLRHAEELKAPASSKNSFLSDLIHNSEYIATLLLKKQPWRVLRPQGSAEFVTTDNPLITFVPIGNGLLHPGYGFGKQMAVAAFPLAPDACLVMGNAWPVPTTLDDKTVDNLNDVFISICDRYVYSKTRSVKIHAAVQKCAGRFRYGENALMPIGMNLPTARQFLRMHFGLDP
jgi:hypothetical protein